jgi:multidrug resistance efflux pump
MTDHAPPTPTAPSQPPPSQPAPPSAPPGARRPWTPAHAGWLSLVLFTAVLVAGVLAVLAAWRLPPFTTPVQRTEDAYVYGHTTVISPEVSGYVWKVPVDDFEQVQASQVLVVIDPRTYQQQLEQARAQLKTAQTNLGNNAQNITRDEEEVVSRSAGISGAKASVDQTTAELRRTQDLVRDGSVSYRENDANVAAVAAASARLQEAVAARHTAQATVLSTEVNGDALRAAVQGAQAQVDAAALQLERTVIHAPVSGQLSEIGVKVGQYVTNGTQLFFLVPPGYWVTANFKERETHGMRVGQRAWFTVDALGGAKVYGHVERLSPATGSQFTVLQPDNATGNFTKIPQRISVRIAVDPRQEIAARLKPGMSVEASVDTST